MATSKNYLNSSPLAAMNPCVSNEMNREPNTIHHSTQYVIFRAIYYAMLGGRHMLTKPLRVIKMPSVPFRPVRRGIFFK